MQFGFVWKTGEICGFLNSMGSIGLNCKWLHTSELRLVWCLFRHFSSTLLLVNSGVNMKEIFLHVFLERCSVKMQIFIIPISLPNR